MVKRNIIFGVVGGLIGLGIHLLWHRLTDVELFDFGLHVVQGVIFSGFGILIGALTAKKIFSK